MLQSDRFILLRPLQGNSISNIIIVQPGPLDREEISRRPITGQEADLCSDYILRTEDGERFRLAGIR